MNINRQNINNQDIKIQDDYNECLKIIFSMCCLLIFFNCDIFIYSVIYDICNVFYFYFSDIYI